LEAPKQKIIYHHTHSPKKYTFRMIDRYLAKGWYRMYQDLFTTTHNLYEEDKETMNRVWWLRYGIDNLTPHESHKKILKRAKSFEITIKRFIDNSCEEHDLYGLYRRNIDFDGYDSLNKCLYGGDKVNSKYNTHIIRIKDKGELIGVGLFDKGFNSLSSEIHFFHPSYKKYSIGKLLILLTIDFMRKNKMKWYYTGYIVVGRPKLDYKLFLGKDSAEYFDYETKSWLPYKDDILEEEHYTSYDLNVMHISMAFTKSKEFDVRELMDQIENDLKSIEANN